MDARFLPALGAIRTGGVAPLRAILAAQPGLARDRSSCSHPTLMQALALDGADHDEAVQLAMARALLERGSPVDEPLIAAASVDNVVVARFLLDHGAEPGGGPGVGSWTPLEESLYWSSPRVRDLLLERGARASSLRAAAGLGRVQDMEAFFDTRGELREDCGGLASPFGSIEEQDAPLERQRLLDNALCYAAMGGHADAVAFLIDRGADPTVAPVGFHFRGTALHWAAIRGHRDVCELLVARGADAGSRDGTIDKTPAEWARHDGHDELAAALEVLAAT